MPPITSSRPGARETRTAPWPNAGSSFLIRRSSVETGSRLSRLGSRGAAGGLGDGDGAGGGKFRLLTFENDLAHETSAALVEPDLQHVTAVGTDRGIGELKAIGAADAVPARALFFEGLQCAAPGGEALAARVGMIAAIVVELEERRAHGLGRIAEAVLELEQDLDAVGPVVAGPIFDGGEGVDAEVGGIEERRVGVLALGQSRRGLTRRQHGNATTTDQGRHDPARSSHGGNVGARCDGVNWSGRDARR